MHSFSVVHPSGATTTIVEGPESGAPPCRLRGAALWIERTITSRGARGRAPAGAVGRWCVRLRAMVPALVLLCLLGLAPPAAAEPWLTLEPLHGDFALRFDEVSRKTRDSGQFGANFEDTDRFVFEELNLRQRMTIYDPRFIQLELGGGFELGQGHKDAEGEDSRITRYNLQASILPTHPYQGTLELRKYDGEFEQSPTTTFVETRKDRAAGLRLTDALLPVPVTLRYEITERSNETLYADPSDKIRRFNLDSRGYLLQSRQSWDSASLHLRYRHDRVARTLVTESQRTDVRYEEDQAQASVSGKAGEDGALRWRTRFDGSDRSEWPRRRQWQAEQSFDYLLYDSHAQSLDAVLSGAYAEQELHPAAAAGADVQRTVTRQTAAGLEHRLYRSVYTRVRVERRSTALETFERVSHSYLLGTRYTKHIPDGNVYGSYAYTLRTEEDRGAQQVPVTDELQTLFGFEPVALAQEHIVAGSIRVTDISGTITYVEGVDYRIFQDGLETYIERVPGSSILNNSEVLVDYVFENRRGRLEERIRDYSLGVKWRFAEPYVKVRDRTQSLEGGDPALLNPGRQTIRGLKLQQAFAGGLVTPAYRVETEDNTQRVQPLERLTRNASLTFDWANGLGALAYRNHTLIDYTAHPDDREQTRTGGKVSYRLGRTSASAEASRDLDEIGDSERRVDTRSTQVTYRYGQWTLSAQVRRAEERYDADGDGLPDYQRDTTRTTLVARRQF